MPTGQANGTRFTWNDSTDKSLLLAIIKLSSPNLPRFEDIATEVGDGLTAKAARTRYYKIRNMLGASADGGDPSPGSGRKETKKKMMMTPVKAGGKRKVVADEDGGDDDDEEAMTPKREKKIKKQEEEEEEEEEAGGEGCLDLYRLE